jgi:hypothetical protein
MRTLTIPYDEDLLRLTGQDPKALEEEARFLLALKWFELGRLSAGKAAEQAGVSKPDFLLRASALGVPVADLDPDQIDAELSAA